jgi:hypothetical protein
MTYTAMEVIVLAKASDNIASSVTNVLASLQVA